MRRERVRALLDAVAAGELDPAAALDRLSFEPVETLTFASIDHHRALRQGQPEVILGEGKALEHLIEIATRVAARGDGVLVTRASEAQCLALAGRLPGCEVNDLARTVYLMPEEPLTPSEGTLLVVTAGTSDLPMAEEAAVTA
ncbi:MAG TPA: hypothetical protein VFX39_10470, partial [Gemmatimonadaceae bacterium]|nr:hypothetical protein [Gemmatimonadaceae bacterium]